MTDKQIDVGLKIDTDVVISSTSGLTVDPQGWHVEVNIDQGQQAVFKVKGQDSSSQSVITGVRSIDQDSGTSTQWSIETVNGESHYTQAFDAEITFELEVDNSNNAGPETRGGGHFRVLDEGAGGPT